MATAPRNIVLSRPGCFKTVAIECISLPFGSNTGHQDHHLYIRRAGPGCHLAFAVDPDLVAGLEAFALYTSAVIRVTDWTVDLPRGVRRTLPFPPHNGYSFLMLGHDSSQPAYNIPIDPLPRRV